MINLKITTVSTYKKMVYEKLKIDDIISLSIIMNGYNDEE
jgi:DNA-binding CsgD family transcriptional regulator